MSPAMAGKFLPVVPSGKYDSGKSNQSSVIKRGGKGWEGGGKFKREGTYGYLCLIHAAIWQKPTQYCKAIIQLKINDLKKNTVKPQIARDHL